jgi:hypothetical protein
VRLSTTANLAKPCSVSSERGFFHPQRVQPVILSVLSS